MNSIRRKIAAAKANGELLDDCEYGHIACSYRAWGPCSIEHELHSEMEDSTVVDILPDGSTVVKVIEG